MALGCFDGLHVGHRRLIAESAELAGKLGLPLAVWSPVGAKKVPTLLSREDKLPLLREMSVDFYAEESFENIRDLTPESFFEDCLCGTYGVSALSCGENFTFGKGACGDAALLNRLCGRAGIAFYMQKTVYGKGTPVSCAAIRTALAEGDPETAKELLGRAYGFGATVGKGRQVGRTIGCPTLNLPLPEDCPLALGVYAVTVTIGGVSHPAVANVGVHPTFGAAGSALCEAHLIDGVFEGSCYGETAKIGFYKKLRGEIAFPTVDALRAQLEKDATEARRFFGKR